MQAQRPRLKVKDLDREGIFFLRQASQREGALFEGGRGRRQLVLWVSLEPFGEKVGKAGNDGPTTFK